MKEEYLELDVIVHAPSILTKDYHGMHLRKNEIDHIVSRPFDTLTGRFVFLNHEYELGSIGVVKSIYKSDIKTNIGVASSLNAKLLINSKTKAGLDAINGIISGKYKYISIGHDYNDPFKHEKGYIDLIDCPEVSICEVPYREGCNILSYKYKGKITQISQTNQIFIFMESNQISTTPQSDSRIVEEFQLNEAEKALLTVIRGRNVEPSELSNKIESQANAIENQRLEDIKFITEVHPDLNDQLKVTPPAVVHVLCRDNRATREFEQKQKAEQAMRAEVETRVKALEAQNKTLQDKLVNYSDGHVLMKTATSSLNVADVDISNCFKLVERQEDNVSKRLQMVPSSQLLQNTNTSGRTSTSAVSFLTEKKNGLVI
jgi:hypothetical protein